jgi:hypothetical protein
VKQLGSNVIERNDAGFEGDGDDRWPQGTADKVEHDPSGYREAYQGAPVRVHLIDRAGADPVEWPSELRVQEFPCPSCRPSRRCRRRTTAAEASADALPAGRL